MKIFLYLFLFFCGSYENVSRYYTSVLRLKIWSKLCIPSPIRVTLFLIYCTSVRMCAGILYVHKALQFYLQAIDCVDLKHPSVYAVLNLHYMFSLQITRPRVILN